MKDLPSTSFIDSTKPDQNHSTSLTVKIKFDNETKRFHAGNTVTGAIQCNFKEDDVIKKITLELNASSFCIFKKRNKKFRSVKINNRKKYKRIILYSSNVEHFYRKVYVEGYNNNIYVRKGLHDYRFAVVLPMKLPPTYQGKYGSIIYTVKANIELLSSIETCVDTIHVIPVLNLTKLMVAKRSFCLTINKKINWFFLRSYVISIEIRAQKTAFVPGEIINFSFYLLHRLPDFVNNIIFELVKKVTFFCYNPEKKTKTVKNILKSGQITFLHKDTKKKVFIAYMQVPYTEPTTLVKDHIIHIEYYINFVCKIPCHADISRQYPIIIGTVPIRSRLSL